MTFFTAVSLLTLSSGAALGTQTSPENKQTICHRTNSNSNPYVVNTPAKSGDVHGHADHTGPVWNSTLKAQHIKWGDIIPPFDYTDQAGSQHFPGLNWNDAGKAIFNNGCNTPPALTVSVLKTNNADGDSTYSHSETSATAGAAVPFKVTVTNNNAVGIVIDSITDTVGGNPISFTCSPVVVGTTLAPGASTVCSFTLTGYSPTSGSKTNTATVNVHQVGNESNTGTGSSTSVVTTSSEPRSPDLSINVVKTNNADGNATFTHNETSSAPNSAVPFKVTVTNTSSVPVVIDTMTDKVGTTPVPFACDVALVGQTLAAGASATCAFTVTGYSPPDGDSKTNTVVVKGHQGPQGENPGDTDNTVTDSDTSTVLTASPPATAPDLSIVKTGPASALKPGQDASYTLTVTNGGTAAASSVIVDDAVPANTTFKSLTATGWACTGAAVHCVLNTPLAVGGTASLTVVVTLAGDYAASTVSNTAVVGPTDSTPSDNTSTVTTDVTHAPDLAIVKTGPEGSLTRGADAAYTLTVTNTGNAPAGSVVVDDAVPANTTLKSVTATGWTCTGTAVHCTLNTPLAAGGTASLNVVLTLAGNYAASSVSNTAVVGPTDATPDDNTSTATTPVTHTPDLAIVKTGPVSVAKGGVITWTLAVSNTGDATATTVTVNDTLPVGVVPGTVSAPGWTCTGTADISCTLDAPLAADDAVALALTATVPTGYSGSTVSNTAVVGPTDATPNDNTSTVVTPVTQPPTGGGGTVTPPTTNGGGTITPPATGGGGQLAFTGVPLTQWLLEGAALLLLGSSLLLLGRRRSTQL